MMRPTSDLMSSVKPDDADISDNITSISQIRRTATGQNIMKPTLQQESQQTPNDVDVDSIIKAKETSMTVEDGNDDYVTDDKSFSLFDANLPKLDPDLQLKIDHVAWQKSKYANGFDFVASKVAEFRAIQKEIHLLELQ